jgi:hypothetical protein
VEIINVTRLHPMDEFVLSMTARVNINGHSIPHQEHMCDSLAI